MNKYSIDTAASVIVLEVKLTARSSAIGRFVLDTGASNIVLPWKLARAIGIMIDPDNMVHTTTATAVETVPEVVIPEVQVLGKSAKNVIGIIKDLPIEARVDGLLGLSFLRHFRLLVDFRDRFITLE